MIPSAPAYGRCIVLALTAFLLWLSASENYAQLPPEREPIGPSSRRSGIVISELMYNPLTNGLAPEEFLDYIEIYNSKPWKEDISGFTIIGGNWEITYTFPPGTFLPPYEFALIALQPWTVESYYGVTGVYGPWEAFPPGDLPNRGNFLIQLRNRQNAVLAAVTYEDSPPWPVSADGKGHSLVLARPSFGEADVRAWAQSDKVGGSPGFADGNSYEPLASVVINEYMAHTDLPFRDAIELYNHSELAVDLSGAYLTDSTSSNKFQIPVGTTIQPHGFVYFDDTVLGFNLFAGGETIFFINPTQTRVIDAVEFKGQSNNMSSGRSPDGGPFHYGLTTPTLGLPNSAPVRYAVVINELMFNPVSGNSDDEYIELYNRSSLAVDMSGWFFQSGLTYTFPTNQYSVIPAGGYLVVAKNPTNLFAIYPNLSSNNTVGPYTGTLANGGERVTLSAAEYVNIVSNGIPINGVKIGVVVSDVTFSDGGRWPDWTDGDGSSLELKDPEAEIRLPSNWADSDITGAVWTAVEYNGPLGEPLGVVTNDSVILGMQGIGECLVDELEVRADNGPNLVVNGGFESGLSGWTLHGSHDFSTIESNGFQGGKCLHIRAGSRGDIQSNRILSSPFAGSIPPGTKQVSIRAKVKWIRGNNELLFRLHGSATEGAGRMQLPRRLGTPGLVNSRRVPNTGPAFYETKHAPLLPGANEAVVITTRANDPQGFSSINVRYRLDPSTNYSNAPMRDDGIAPDAVPFDGIYSGTIPGQASNRIVAFYVAATDNLGATGTFPQNVFPPPGLPRCWPNDAITRECVIRWGERQMPGEFATYHLWLTAANSNRWATRDPMNNLEMDATFVYNNTRVIYNALPLYSGSPWHRTNAITGPAGPNRVDFEMNFPNGDVLLGESDFILNNCGNPDILTISDLSAVNEQTIYKLFEAMNLQHNHRRYFHFFVNGIQRSVTAQRSGNFIFEDSQQPNGNMQFQWFPEDANGTLYKLDDWFEFDRNGFDIVANNDADLTRRTVVVDGKEQLAGPAYRYMFRKRSAGVGELAADLQPLFDLIDVVSPVENPNSATIDPFCFSAVADLEQWMRMIAVQRAIGNFDSYGWNRGKNAYLYKPQRSGFQFMTWDIDYGLGLGREVNAPLFESNDPRVLAMFNTPEFLRAYWRAFDEMVKGPFSNGYLDPIIDERVNALVASDVNIDMNAVAAIKTFINQRRAFLLTQLAPVASPFTLSGPAFFTSTNDLQFFYGTAPVEAKYVTLNGFIYPVTWTSVSNFTMRVVIKPGTNTLEFGLLNLYFQPVGAPRVVEAIYTGPYVDPKDILVFNEIMYSPALPGAQYIEILNRTNRAYDLWGWDLYGTGKAFGPGTIITNGQIVVLVRDVVQFKRAHPGVRIFDTFPDPLSEEEQILALLNPAGSAENFIVDAIRYEGVAPWPDATVGRSLQLIDKAQDNSRPSNWVIDHNTPFTPGTANSVVGTLPPYDRLYLNELQIESFNGPTDNFGERDPWVELYNAGTTTLNLDGYYLANNYETNTLLQYRFPNGTSLSAGERRLVWLDGEPAESAIFSAHTPFRSDYSGKLALSRLVNQKPQITDYLTWTRLPANVSYGDQPDGQLVFRYRFRDVTPLNPNIRRLNVVINEWLASNSGNPPLGIRDPANNLPEDWFEIYNGELYPIDLGGCFLTDNVNQPNRSPIPNNGFYVIPPGGFLLVWADTSPGANSTSHPDLHADFRLSAGGEAIALYDPFLNPIDIITFGAQVTDISEGRYGDGSELRFSMSRPTPRGPNSIVNYNSAPRFPVIADRTVAPGTTLTIPVTASDPDGNAITYSLDTAPPGATVLAGGTFRWIVPANQTWAEYPVTVRATDNGSPQRFATVSFTVTIGSPYGPPPVIYEVANVNGMATFTFTANIGRTYRVFYKDNLEGATWTQLDRDFVAANTSVSITDHLNAQRRFYRVQILE
jgi:hypothetical protein